VTGTLARALRRLLALELGLYLLVGFWLVRTHGWSSGAAVATALGCALLWRAGFGLATYAVAGWWRSPVPAPFRIGPIRFIGHAAAELAALGVAYAVFQPFERAWMGATGPKRASGRRLPVILVHGYVCNRAMWLPLARALRARGEDVWAASYEPVYGSIDLAVPQLAAQLDAALAASGCSRVVLLAHSMGGLVARAYLQAHGGAKVARIVTLGTPHLGSMHAHLGAGQNAREMEPGSAWLAALAGAERKGLAAPLVAIYSHHDNFVAPQSSGAHPQARNVALAGVGHVAMHYSRAVRAMVLREIDAANETALEVDPAHQI
jgi:pimeloyl-ACP methyl ester carboxylesterase